MSSHVSPQQGKGPPRPRISLATREVDPRQAIRVFCYRCLEVWTVADLPVELDRLTAILAVATCPNCGGRDIRVQGVVAQGGTVDE